MKNQTSRTKRWFAVLSLVMGVVLGVHAQRVEINGLYYELNTSDRTATLTYENTTTSNYANLSASVTVPASVTHKGISFDVTTISDRAFANCTALQSISIPGSVTAIGTTATLSSYTTEGTKLPFYNCTSLKSLRLEDGASNVVLTCHNYNQTSESPNNRGMFYSCPLEEVYIGRNIEYKTLIDIYNYNRSYPFEAYPQSYGYSAFYNQPKLAKVTIGEQVTDIPAYLFYKCPALASVHFGMSLKSIPKHAFQACNLQSVDLPNTVSSIAEYAFTDNASLATVNIGTSVETIGEYAFSGCVQISNLQLGQKLRTIGNSAFQSVGKSVTDGFSFIFPETVTTIGQSAFSSSGLTSVDIPNSVTTIGQEAFFKNLKLKSFTSGSGCTTLPVGVLDGCTSLTNLIISEGVTTISDRAFANCTALQSISIPGSVTAIGTTSTWSSSTTHTDSTEGTDLPFYNCTSLKYLRLEDGASPVVLTCHNYNKTSASPYNRGMFYSCPLEEVYIGRHIEYKTLKEFEYGVSYSYPFEAYPQSYGYSAFYYQPKLAKVTIGEQVTDISAYLFYRNPSIILMTLPNVKNIGKGAFKQCSKLTTLNLGQQLETIGDEVFYGCSNVTKLTFPNTLKTIGNHAFYDCSSVTEVTVGTGLQSIGSYGFYGCESFTALILPDTFTTMGESAFEGCRKLTVAQLGNSLTDVPAKAFKDCISLTEMVLPATVKSLGDQALYNDSTLAVITLNEGLKTIGKEVFWNNSGVMRFSIPGTVTSIGQNSFYGCTNAISLIFCDGAETLTIHNGQSRSSLIDAITTDMYHRDRECDYFYDCPVRTLTLGRNLTYSFSDDSRIYDFDGEKFTRVERASAPFMNKATLRSVKIGPYVTFLHNHLFDGCVNLTNLKMGQNLRIIDNYAFNRCANLAEITFPNPLIKLGVSSFANCSKLHTTKFNNSTEPTDKLEIHDYAFSNCPVLKTVVFPSHLYKIHNYVYESCPSLNELSFPANLISIGDYVFKNTEYLTDITFQDSYTPITLGHGAADAYGRDVLGLPLFGNSILQSLYIGRNIYHTTRNKGYDSPFYKQQRLTDVRFSQADHVTYCEDYLLYAVNNCKTLVLPESLQTIGDYTFASMTKLNGITIPNKVTEVGTYAFANDEALKYAHLSTACPWLKEGLFSSCDSLEAIVIPPVVNKMGAFMFSNCKSLKSATFEGAADVIDMAYGASQGDYGLFRDCPLETLYLDRWLSYNTYVPSRSPFYSIATLKNMTLGSNVKAVDKYMFSYCTGLKEVYLPDNIESVGMWGFRGCSSLRKVRFSEKLKQIADYGFSECTSLDNVVFPASMTSVADNSFSNCTSLKKLDLGNTLNIIGPAAFKNDIALEGIVIPATLYGLGVEAFANCKSLPNVTIQSISSVGKQAFEGCTGLQWVSLSEKTTSLGENSFAGCSGIKYIKSYAQIPPEGLVNFVADVPANGTLFVPEFSIEDYQFSPTWDMWFDIRPLNENVMVSSIELDKTNISFKASESVTLTATVGAVEATDKGVLWRSSADSIASVNHNGVVTAIAVGKATITALAADGSGVKAECKVTVDSTLVETINISGAATSLKKGRQLTLQAEVLPATATSTAVIWSSSDKSIATVDENGVVTAVAAGDVTIKATAADASGTVTLYALKVLAPTKGDSNDNDAVTITDAVNTANYAVGNPVENFCFEAADVNGNNQVTLADASGTVTILLNMPITSGVSKANSSIRLAKVETDVLNIDNYSANQGESTTVNVFLDNTTDYVAMQADIVLPEGMSVESIHVGDRAANHSLMTRQIDANTIRVVLFDLANKTFDDSNNSLLSITFKVNSADTGDILINNIIASDSQAREYVLTSAGGHNNIVSGLTEVNSETVKVITENGEISVLNAAGREIAVYDLDGTVLTRFKAKSSVEKIRQATGVYVVTVGDYVTKVVLKNSLQ